MKRRRARGAVMVEYAFLLLAFGLPVAAGITAGGVSLLKNYRTTRAVILSPMP